MLTLKGRFKGEVDKRWHLVPISDATRSGLPFRKWMERVLHRRVNLQDRESGWLFQDRQGARLKFGQYDLLYRALVDQARERHPRLLPEAVETKDFVCGGPQGEERFWRLQTRTCQRRSSSSSTAGARMRRPRVQKQASL
jgi:hypothetical protein